MSLLPTVWNQHRWVSRADCEQLLAPFLLEGDFIQLGGMISNTAPGPGWFPDTFYKTFWNVVGPYFLKLVQDFAKGCIDVKRLNYGILALLPKVEGSDHIRQYRPITLINVSSRLLAKGMLLGWLQWRIG